MDIAKKLGLKPADVQRVLTQLGAEPVKIEVLKAEYGADKKQKDVTELLRRHIGMTPIVNLPSAQYNTAFGGDPVPGVPKKLTIRYRLNGKEGTATFAENAAIVLPVPK